MLIIGCDFHSRFQQIAMLDPSTGEVLERRLEHENEEAKKVLCQPSRSGASGDGSDLHAFFKGALLNDPKHILQKIGEHTQAGRWIKFTSLKEITAMQSILRNYIYEAIEIEESGKKVTFKKVSEYAVPEELQARLDAAPELRAAFEALTPGRRKSYIFHVSGAKQAKTRASRAERCVPMILSGRGFNERPD